MAIVLEAAAPDPVNAAVAALVEAALDSPRDYTAEGLKEMVDEAILSEGVLDRVKGSSTGQRLGPAVKGPTPPTSGPPTRPTIQSSTANVPKNSPRAPTRTQRIRGSVTARAPSR